MALGQGSLQEVALQTAGEATLQVQVLVVKMQQVSLRWLLVLTVLPPPLALALALLSQVVLLVLMLQQQMMMIRQH